MRDQKDVFVTSGHEAVAEKVRSSNTTKFVKITTIVFILIVTHCAVWFIAMYFAPKQQPVQIKVSQAIPQERIKILHAFKAKETKNISVAQPPEKKRLVPPAAPKQTAVAKPKRVVANTINAVLAPLDKTSGQRIIICNSKFEADLSSVQSHFTVNGIDTIICKIKNRKRWVLATRESFDNTTNKVEKFKEAIAKIGATYNRDKMKNAPSFPASTFTSAYQVNAVDLTYFETIK